MGNLYRLDFASGKSYIGITTSCIKHRIGGHRTAAKIGSRLAISRAWRRWGEPVVSVIAEAQNREELLILEVLAIEFFGTLVPGGYNLTPGGDFNPSELDWVNKKRSSGMKGRPPHPNSLAAVILANTGRAPSEEARKKMSAAGKGKPKSEEHRRKIGLALRGRTQSPEAVEKMRIALTGRKNPEHSLRMMGNQNWKHRKPR